MKATILITEQIEYNLRYSKDRGIIIKSDSDKFDIATPVIIEVVKDGYGNEEELIMTDDDYVEFEYINNIVNHIRTFKQVEYVSLRSSNFTFNKVLTDSPFDGFFVDGLLDQDEKEEYRGCYDISVNVTKVYDNFNVIAIFRLFSDGTSFFHTKDVIIAFINNEIVEFIIVKNGVLYSTSEFNYLRFKQHFQFYQISTN